MYMYIQVPQSLSACSVCYCEFQSSEVNNRAGSENNRMEMGGDDEEEYAILRPLLNGCGHSHVCEECLEQYLNHKITDKDVLPWLQCPVAECK